MLRPPLSVFRLYFTAIINSIPEYGQPRKKFPAPFFIKLVKPGIFGYNGLCIQTTKPKGDLYVQV
jgi:hypothetical protein